MGMKRAQIAWFALWILLIAAGGYFRLSGLTDRPVHFDEATGAHIVAAYRASPDESAFTPEHFHGPLQPMLAALLCKLNSQRDWSSLQIGTLRLIPATFGILLLFVPLLMRRQLGGFGALTATALLATSPLIVYYNRMFIHESILLFFSILCIPILIRFIERPNYLNGCLLGMILALMWATKETALIVWLSYGIGGWAFLLISNKPNSIASLTHKIREMFLPKLIAVGTLFVTALVLFSNFMQDPGAFVDAFRTFWAYSVTSGHNKPFAYYFSLIGTPHVIGSVVFWEAVVLLLIVPVWVAFVTGQLRSHSIKVASEQGRGVILFLALALLVQLITYSLIAYKTPWLMLVPVAILFLLVAACVNPLSTNKSSMILVAFSIVIIFSLQIPAALQGSQRLASHPRNPYAYVPTLQSVESLPRFIGQLQQHTEPASPMFVVGSHYWPLPWYLRNSGTTGYLDSTDSLDPKTAIVIAMPHQFDAVDDLLKDSHHAFPRGLRLDFPMIVYVRNDILAKYRADNP
jgi:uncharacterized protein (TIGR03663 family)